MKYLLLVSHGEFSQGLKSSLAMFAADKVEEVVAVGLKNGESVEQLADRFKQQLAELGTGNSFVVLGDIIGGSPLTTVCNVLAQADILKQTIVLGGMNLPMALNAVMLKDTLSGADFVKAVLSEAQSSLKEFKPSSDLDDDDDEDI
ncbi:MAG: PTS fructose transporter subunit IIA [Liquorilactobacillus nagelii]|jgi:PTS system N-acetylgalactosamine-specific IIA component|uniref:PTS sugar transporter subunit IIA n=1 Tax=Liquorilactobacillus nagelii TaxID=82688 RepID=UPI0024307EF0|nr:PTS fructose transporter subunit IIA [Liquorilactobacillus nagelii]MCI1634016.1 PTS fructose transporter subunit IIA [Liquorilactobacillus nagelii]